MTEKELKQSFNKTNYDSVYQKNIKRIIDLLVVMWTLCQGQ